MGVSRTIFQHCCCNFSCRCHGMDNWSVLQATWLLIFTLEPVIFAQRNVYLALAPAFNLSARWFSTRSKFTAMTGGWSRWRAGESQAKCELFTRNGAQYTVLYASGFIFFIFNLRLAGIVYWPSYFSSRWCGENFAEIGFDFIFDIMLLDRRQFRDHIIFVAKSQVSSGTFR